MLLANEIQLIHPFRVGSSTKSAKGEMDGLITFFLTTFATGFTRQPQ